MFKLVHGGPVFAKWGRIIFSSRETLYKRSFILVRIRDGAVASSWNMGRGDIRTFETIEDAINFYNGHCSPRQLNGNPCIIVLHRKEYKTISPLSSPEFIEDVQAAKHFNIRVFHYALPKTFQREATKLFHETLWHSALGDDTFHEYYRRSLKNVSLEGWYFKQHKKVSLKQR